MIIVGLQMVGFRLRKLVFALFGATAAIGAAEAQVMVDVSKITCDQYITQRITHSQTVNVWLSGFYAGRRNNPMVDTQALSRNANRVSRFCESHRDMQLLDAVEAVMK
ncbi:hypothetical protein D6B98_26975 [Bradyrhizobium sp. LVM 105]|uniref:HdeA/HdeB family protein n=2 Tax=Nitrobacteraceae TaxID=41294 RepID=A0A4Y9L3J4_9BRAD|nr:hypothetical protein D6B98_26975 [Bradyrhizobium sp. LVM 105]TFV36402.1 hypothetical protein E4K66_23520 [Bradyrhizobium frederickii]